jgi:exodeoxyribonuclease V alpha subunit
VELDRSYRFGPESGIGALSRAVNRGEGREAVAVLKGGAYPDLAWRQAPPEEALGSALKGHVLRHFAPLVGATDSDTAVDLLSGFRVLCAVRKGPYGVEAANRAVERILREERLVHPAGRYYHGCPVLITANDYRKGLFNGDLGIVWKGAGAAGQLRAFFRSPDRGTRGFLPAALPPHETAWAMTVHKGQGSEFDRALFLLPDAPGPLLARELIYTAVTRARRFMEIWARESVFEEAVRRRTVRASGLHEALWGSRWKVEGRSEAEIPPGAGLKGEGER